MPKATLPGGPLIPLKDCYVTIPSPQGSSDVNCKIEFNVLPEISDTKNAEYSDESALGRGSPMKTYQYSGKRAISLQIHLIVTKPDDVERNLEILRCIESAVYPREGTGGAPFLPPPICRLKCGNLLAANELELCVVLMQYSVKFPTEVAWDESTFTPFKFDIDTTWELVYKSSELPGQERIIKFGV